MRFYIFDILSYDTSERTFFVLIKNCCWGWGFSSVVERLPSKHKALGSVPSSKKKLLFYVYGFPEVWQKEWQEIDLQKMAHYCLLFQLRAGVQIWVHLWASTIIPHTHSIHSQDMYAQRDRLTDWLTALPEDPSWFTWWQKTSVPPIPRDPTPSSGSLWH